MSLLDVTNYDLTTQDGQATAVSDIITELNNQYNSSNTIQVFKIASFGMAKLTIGAFNTTSTTSVNHGLGFSPPFAVYYFDVNFNSYIPLIAGGSGTQFVPTLQFETPLWAYSDSNKLYFSAFNNDAGAPLTVDLVYYIFNLPLPT